MFACVRALARVRASVRAGVRTCASTSMDARVRASRCMHCTCASMYARARSGVMCGGVRKCVRGMHASTRPRAATHIHTQSGHDWAFCAWAGVGTLLALLLLTGMERKIKTTYLFSGEKLGFEQAGVFWPVVFINSMAGVAGMLFAAPSSPLIQPRMLIGGHMIAASSAICADYLSNPQRGMDLLPRWVATPLAPALTILIQSKVGLLHPPACAAAVIFMEGEAEIKNMDWLFVLCPVLLDCVLLVACAVVINNLSPNRAYPLFW